MKRIKKIILRSLTYILGLTTLSETNAGILRLSIENETNQEMFYAGKVTDYSEIKGLEPATIETSKKLIPGKRALFQVNIIVKAFVKEKHFEYVPDSGKLGVDLYPDKKDKIILDTPNGPLEIMFDRYGGGFSTVFKPIPKQVPEKYELTIFPEEHGNLLHAVIKEKK